MMEVDIKENEEKEESNESARNVLETWVAEQDDKVQSMFKDGIAGLTSALAKEREAAKEAASLKKQLEDAQMKLDGYKTDEEKALDALQAEKAELTTKLAEAEKQAVEAVDALIKGRISFTVTANAMKMGFEDPKDAESLLPKDAVKFNRKTNEVEGAEEALKALAEAKPYLLGKGDGVGTPRGSGKGKLSKTDEVAAPSGLKF